MTTTEFTLRKNPFGRLTLIRNKWELFDDVYPVRAFPFQALNQYISMVTASGKEVAWINTLSDLSPEVQKLVTEELEHREFMPEIQCIHQVSSYITPCTWQVLTDKGTTSFELLEDGDIQRAGTNTLMITDSHNTHFLIRDINALDKLSRKILDRFW